LQAKYLAASTGQEEETIMRDFSRPKYFSPFEAADYGIIDQVGRQGHLQGLDPPPLSLSLHPLLLIPWQLVEASNFRTARP
jgi:hypothetical protein